MEVCLASMMPAPSPCAYAPWDPMHLGTLCNSVRLARFTTKTEPESLFFHLQIIRH